MLFFSNHNYFNRYSTIPFKFIFGENVYVNTYYRHDARRGFGLKHVTQKQRYMLRILHPQQSSHYKGEFGPDGLLVKDALPKSLLCTSAIRKLVYANTANAMELSGKIKWDKFKCNVTGVRWHPSGSWRVQFKKSNFEHNFFVNCSCYFSCHLYGFDKAKELAIEYRRRLEREYEELERAWATMN